MKNYLQVISIIVVVIIITYLSYTIRTYRELYDKRCLPDNLKESVLDIKEKTLRCFYHEPKRTPSKENTKPSQRN
jgi:hypothetical protein